MEWEFLKRKEDNDSKFLFKTSFLHVFIITTGYYFQEYQIWMIKPNYCSRITSCHIHLLSKKDCKILGNSGLTWCCCFTLLEVADCGPSFCFWIFKFRGGGVFLVLVVVIHCCCLNLVFLDGVSCFWILLF